MKREWLAFSVSIWQTIDWTVYLGLFLMGSYCIQRDNVLGKFSMRRTNYARYQEPIVERPTASIYITGPWNIRLKYGRDFKTYRTRKSGQVGPLSLSTLQQE